jgi:hypothetical protein
VVKTPSGNGFPASGSSGGVSEAGGYERAILFAALNHTDRLLDSVHLDLLAIEMVASAGLTGPFVTDAS